MRGIAECLSSLNPQMLNGKGLPKVVCFIVVLFSRTQSKIFLFVFDSRRQRPRLRRSGDRCRCEHQRQR